MRRGPSPKRKSLEALSDASRESIAVIVIGLNVERWIAECIASIRAQTMQPDELIFVDDGSDDETRAIVYRLGVTSVQTTGRTGMSAARMYGLSFTSSTLILCVDGDDVMPPDYIARLYEALGPNHVLAYPGAFQYIGERRRARKAAGNAECLREHIKPSRRQLWRSNHVSTSSLMRRADLIACGGWRDNDCHRMNDWDLALRMSARGDYARGATALHYRMHAANNSSRDYGFTRDEARGIVRRKAASLTVATIYSGRVAGLFDDWLCAIGASLMYAGKSAELLILDDSDSSDLARLTPNVVFTSITIRRSNSGMKTGQRRPDKHATCEFLAAQFNDVLQRANTDIIWMIEDDVVVPLLAADALLHELLCTADGARPAVAGCYRSRHKADQWIASNVIAGRPQRITELPLEPAPVQLTGTGCLMVLRDMLGPVRFSALWHHGCCRVCAHDWTFSWQLHQRETPVILVPAVVCRHHTTVDEWV